MFVVDKVVDEDRRLSDASSILSANSNSTPPPTTGPGARGHDAAGRDGQGAGPVREGRVRDIRGSVSVGEFGEAEVVEVGVFA